MASKKRSLKFPPPEDCKVKTGQYVTIKIGKHKGKSYKVYDVFGKHLTRVVCGPPGKPDEFEFPIEYVTE